MGSSWAADEADRDAWIAFARALEGRRLATVRYLDIDYRRHDVAPDYDGLREITDEGQWAAPTFEFPGGHTVDFGVELETDDGFVYSVTWTPPGDTEGLEVHHEALAGGALSDRPSAAVWDVSTRTTWRAFLGHVVTRVDVHYEPWDDAGAWWCMRLEFHVDGAGTVELSLAQGNPDGTVEPSSDNVVVRLSEHA
ncbi:MAG TPA: hypothetical protein VF230_12455 [Acidimicrobiales bacterium]